MRHIKYLRNEYRTLLNHRKNLLLLIKQFVTKENIDDIIKYSKQLEETQTKLYLIEKWIDIFKNVIDN